MPKLLKPYYFIHGIVSCFVGFPRVGRVKDRFYKCLFCIDMTIAKRCLTALHDHRRGEGYESLEVPYRLLKGWTLYNRACKQPRVPERARSVASVEGLPAVNLERMFAVSIDEVMAHETAAEMSTENCVVTQATADRLWVSRFLDSFVRGRDFLSEDRSLETLNATLVAELQRQQSLTDESLCQVSVFCVYCVLVWFSLFLRTNVECDEKRRKCWTLLKKAKEKKWVFLWRGE